MSKVQKKKAGKAETLLDELEDSDPVAPVEDALIGDVPDAEVLPDVEIVEPTVDVDVPPGKAPGRRSIGAKEVIPFAWKLVGKSDGLTLTLFKAVEREEVEAQLDRSQREGYYSDLRILPIAPPPPAAPHVYTPAPPAAPEKGRVKSAPAAKPRKEAKPAKAPAAAKPAKAPAAPPKKAAATRRSKAQTAKSSKGGLKKTVKKPSTRKK